LSTLCTDFSSKKKDTIPPNKTFFHHATLFEYRSSSLSEYDHTFLV